jgi:hypothetical protein
MAKNKPIKFEASHIVDSFRKVFGQLSERLGGRDIKNRKSRI